jgi:CRISPR-associated protein Cas5t
VLFKLYAEAPFAAYRPLWGGWFRPTAIFMSHSAAYGLLLNIAGIDYRVAGRHNGATPPDPGKSPRLRIAVGCLPKPQGGPSMPSVGSSLEQLHVYPLNGEKTETSKKTKTSKTKTLQKTHVRPVTGEFLVNLKAVIGIDAEPDLVEKLRDGLNGNLARRGAPFAGDSNMGFSYLEEYDGPAYWFSPFNHQVIGQDARYMHSTLWIDRHESNRTRTGTFVLGGSPEVDVPEGGWVTLPPTDWHGVTSKRRGKGA